MNEKNHNKINLDIDLENIDQRVDVYVTAFFESFSRTRIQKLISDGSVLVNNKPVRSSYKLRYGDNIDIILPENKPIEISSENIPLDFIYEDDDLAVVNKPHGMITHPAPGKYSGTLVNALLYHCKDSLSGINGVLRPGIVHRLDKDTSGLIIIAKNDKAHHSLATQIQDRSIDKYYVAIVQGNIKEDKGVIDAPIARHPTKRERMAVVEGGRGAITFWSVLERFKTATLVEAKLLTGRTHQLRVHFSHIRHNILGDPVYSNLKTQKIKLNRQLLQAYKLSFTHPSSGERLNFEIDFDEDITKVLKIFNSKYITGVEQ